jgi:hypothetical protein
MPGDDDSKPERNRNLMQRLDPSQMVNLYLKNAKGRLKAPTYRTHKEVMELYLDWFQDGDLGHEAIVSSIPEFLTRFIDMGVDEGVTFRKAAGTVLKQFATFLKPSGLVEPAEVSEIASFVKRRNKLLSDPLTGFAECLKEQADRWDYDGDQAVTGKFILGNIGRNAVLFEAIESDAPDPFPPFWLEVGEEAAELCEMAAEYNDVILEATVARRFGAWAVVNLEGVGLL